MEIRGRDTYSSEEQEILNGLTPDNRLKLVDCVRNAISNFNNQWTTAIGPALADELNALGTYCEGVEVPTGTKYVKYESIEDWNALLRPNPRPRDRNGLSPTDDDTLVLLLRWLRAPNTQNELLQHTTESPWKEQIIQSQECRCGQRQSLEEVPRSPRRTV
jgi:hypothetical protein